jgi:beta-galactosidase
MLSLRLFCFLLGMSLLTSAAQAQLPSPPNKEIRPGEIWLDTAGKPINAHGGGLLFHNGVYYWYGEIKEGRTYTPERKKPDNTRVDVVGVSCYSSKDLLNWKYEGNVLPAKRGTDLDPSRVLERPKVIYNAKTGKFVMWFHADSANYAAASVGVAVANSPTGPFTYLGSFRPNKGQWPINVTEQDKADPKSLLVRDFAGGQMSRDLTIFVDDDGKAYLFAAAEGNPTMHVSELTDDYLGLTGKYARIFIGRSMEAPAVFKRGGKYYLIASGCTGWAPNPARSAVADSVWGPWIELGNPCRGPEAEITFRGQSTYVQPVIGKQDEFIFMADRWNKNDLADSRYLWLPLTFTADGKPEVHWQDAWKPAAK